MESEYESVVNKIKTYLEENNLGNFEQELFVEELTKFKESFSPEKLEKLEGTDILNKIFPHDSDKSTMSYYLEYVGIFGGIRGGYPAVYGVYKSSKTNSWVMGSGKNAKVLNEDETIEIAESIIVALSSAVHLIKNSIFNTVDDYVNLESELKTIFNDCPVKADYSWVHKYFALICPDVIPVIHQDEMKKNMIRKFHLEPLKGYYANDAQLYFLSRDSGIKFYSLFHEDIVGLFYHWDDHMWVGFDENNLIKGDNIKYWAFTPGIMANRFDLCYEKSIMALGWNYLGDLSKYDENFEEILADKIKRKEKLKAKPVSALRSLSAIYKDIKAGDVICIRRGLSTILAIGEVTSDSKYFYDETLDEFDDPFYQLRDGIKWRKLDEEYQLKGAKFLRDTLYEIKDEKIIKIIREINEKTPKEHIAININYSRNLIYFGAPGTGKSYNLDENAKDFGDNCERVTFHENYSYANFVGTYKPIPTEDGRITYEYVPGPFMQLLIKVFNNPNDNFLLIIEEINRANTAAVFGDVFQLLDRDDDGNSKYYISASKDVRNYLENNINESNALKQLNYEKYFIPKNMYIWATMNSADQGVFPVDTAFKRRWDFEYLGIDEGEDRIKNIKVIWDDETEFNWNTLRKAINHKLLSYNINEDKFIGPFFAFHEKEYRQTGIIPKDDFVKTFKNKIIMYLFEDAARSKRTNLFKGVKKEKESNITFSEVCEAFDDKNLNIFHESIVKEVFREDDQ